MKTAILQKSLGPAQNSLLGLLQKAIANFAIREGSRRLWVRIEGRSVVQTERLEPQGYEKQSNAPANALSLKLLAQDEWGNRYISRIKKHLEEHLDDFPLYSAYKGEQEMTAPEGCNLCLEDGTGNWQLELAPGALNVEGNLERGSCAANCTCSRCGEGKVPVFRL